VAFVPIRKKGKLPFETIEESYALEYGTATVEVHSDAVRPGARVLLIDDLIATGGTMMAGKRLLERLGATVIEGAAIVDLPELGGSAKLREWCAISSPAGSTRIPPCERTTEKIASPDYCSVIATLANPALRKAGILPPSRSQV
jgi:hypothetical protein